MNHIRPFAASLTFAAPLALLFFSSLASAQESSCASNTDCPKGYECQVFEWGACSGSAGCEPGAECPPPEEPVCETGEYRECVAIPNGCDTNADCDSGMVCFTHTYDRCDPVAAYACAPNTDCPPPPEPTCETTTERSCVPQYMLPCQAAADCGTGFDCKPVEMCTCSGGTAEPTPAPDTGSGGAPSSEPQPLPPESSCTCETGDSGYCQVIERACTSDAECPTDWTCSANYVQSDCVAPSTDPAAPADCGTTEAPSMVCMPPYANTVIGVASDGGAVYASDPEAAPTVGIDEDSAAAPENANATKGSSSGSESSSGDDGGCSVSGAGAASGSSGMLLALLGLTSVLRRRRR